MNKLISKIKYLSLLTALAPASVFAYNFETDSGLGQTANRAGYTNELNKSVDDLIMQGISVVLTFVGVIFLLLMIMAGFRWMTARGNESEVEKAKKTVTQSIIGIIIVFAAYAISYFVINLFSGTVIN